MANSTASKIVCLFLILSLAVPGTLATNYEVCANLGGWKVGVDILGWLLPLTIRVEDTFHFTFNVPTTVAVVDQFAYLTCDASKAQINDVSGSFTYKFTKSGLYYFISAAAGECAAGLKMQVLVL